LNFIWNINLALGSVFNLILSPFATLSPIWGLAFISCVTGAIMVLIFKYVSQQQGIRQAKARMRGYFLEVWLYKHDFYSVIAAVGRILKANLNYMKFALSPLLVLMPPVILIMIHLNLFYGYSPLRPGETALMTVKWNNPKTLVDTSLTACGGTHILIDGSPVRALGKNEVTWRLKTVSPGAGRITITWSGNTAAKSAVAGGKQVVRLSPQRSHFGSLADAIFSPGERPLDPKLQIEWIRISYPERKIDFLGMEIHWIILFFILSIAAGFVLKGVFKVEI